MTGVQRAACAALEAAGAAYTLLEHPAAHTVEELHALGLPGAGAVAKNLFLREDRGERHFLLTLRQEKKADLKAVRAAVGCRRLTFAGPEELRALLGLAPGSVSPLGALNDRAGRVELLLDRDFAPEDPIGIHPNENTATLWLAAGELMRVLALHGHPVRLVAPEG